MRTSVGRAREEDDFLSGAAATTTAATTRKTTTTLPLRAAEGARAAPSPAPPGQRVVPKARAPHRRRRQRIGS